MIKRIGLVLMVVMMVLSVATISFADDVKDSLKDKADSQNESILKMIKDRGIHTKDGDYSKVLNSFSSQRRNDDGFKVTDLKQVKTRLREMIFTFAITSRKYTIPIYMITLIVTVVLIAGLGAKSLKKRKMWIIFAVTISFLFLIFINIPLFIIYTQSKAGQPLNLDYYYNVLYDIVFFLKANSFTISIILAAYGFINKLLGKNDIPRRAVASFLLKASVINFITIQGVTIVMKFII